MTKRRRAFTLIECLAWLSLVGVFIMLSTYLWRANHEADREARHLQAETARLDMLLDRLKSDAWGALDARMSETGAVLLEQPYDATVGWQVLDGGTIERAVFNAEKRVVRYNAWPPFAERVTFELTPGGIAVTVTPVQHDAPPALTIPVASLAGGAP